MTSQPPKNPALTAKAQAEKAARAAREAAALRENLRKRKQQARARTAEDPPPSDQESPHARDV